MVGDGNAVEVRIQREGFFPKLEILTATFTYTLWPCGRVCCNDSLQRTNCHTILSPIAIKIGVGRQEVGHNLLTSSLIPPASVSRQNVDTRIFSPNFSDTVHASNVGGVAR